MSFSNLSTTPPSSESLEEPSAEYAAEHPTNTSPPHVTVNEESHASVQAGNRSAEFTTMRQISKIMCVTTNGALMVIAWAIAAMTYSWLSAYWLYATVPAYRYHQYLVTYSYPMGVALVIPLLFFPALAVIGDVRCGNLKLMLIIMIPMNIAGLLSYGGLSFLSALMHAKMISYLFVISYLLLFFCRRHFSNERNSVRERFPERCQLARARCFRPLVFLGYLLAYACLWCLSSRCIYDHFGRNITRCTSNFTLGFNFAFNLPFGHLH